MHTLLKVSLFEGQPIKLSQFGNMASLPSSGMQTFYLLPPFFTWACTGVLRQDQVQSLHIWVACFGKPEDVKQVAAMPNLKQLHLGFMTFTAGDCAASLQHLQGAAKLKSLEIIGGGVYEPALKTLATFTQLTSLMILAPFTEEGGALNRCLVQLAELRHLAVRLPEDIESNDEERDAFLLSMQSVARALPHLQSAACNIGAPLSGADPERPTTRPCVMWAPLSPHGRRWARWSTSGPYP